MMPKPVDLAHPWWVRLLFFLSTYVTAIRLWIRLRRNGWTLRKLDAHIAGEREDWYPGRAWSILLHPKRALFQDLMEVVVHCHGFRIEQIDEDFWEFAAGFFPSIWVLRSRPFKILCFLYYLPYRLSLTGISILRRHWQLAVLLAMVLLGLGRWMVTGT